MRFGRLLVVDQDGKNKHGQFMWKCLCDCGKTKSILGCSLWQGRTTSCRCIKIKHGHTVGGNNSPEWKIYKSAKARCRNRNGPRWSDYGGRGIEFKFTGFPQFLKELGLRPTSRHSLDRIDNDGHYEPGNVRWATRSEQSKNRRKWAKINKKGRLETCARYGPNSDVYVFRTISGFECCADEHRDKRTYKCVSSQEMVDHLSGHILTGDKVPKEVFASLETEMVI